MAVTGHHRKHAIRLLRRPDDDEGALRPVRDRPIYDETVRESLIMVWEAADRICGKRLKAALPHLVESMERHGHLDLDPEVKARVLSATAATLDRLLKPIRPTAGSRRRPRRGRSMGKRVPVRTYNDRNEPPPGFLEIDLVAHHCRTVGGFVQAMFSPTCWRSEQWVSQCPKSGVPRRLSSIPT